MSHEHKLMLMSRCPIRWGDMDALGHVNNTVYFRYMEQARVDWFDSLPDGAGFGGEFGVVVVNAACEFLLPINYPGVIETSLFAGAPGRSSVQTWYELRVAGEDRLYARGHAKLVWIDRASGKSVPLPDVLRAALAT